MVLRQHPRQSTALEKAKVESAVLLAQRWVLARLRDQTFFSLAALNQAISALLDELNDRPLQQLGVSRRALHEQIDRPALTPLPAVRYVRAEWKPCRVNIDYHVEVARHLYSVPYQLIHERVEARFTPTTVEIYFKGRRITSHRRRDDGQPSTKPEHMPRSHRAPCRVDTVAPHPLGGEDGSGHRPPGRRDPAPAAHPEQGYRACLGLMRLGRRYGAARLEAASARAAALGSYRYRTVTNILNAAQDRLPPRDGHGGTGANPDARQYPRRDLLRAAREEDRC